MGDIWPLTKEESTILDYEHYANEILALNSHKRRERKIMDVLKPKWVEDAEKLEEAGMKDLGLF